MAMKIPLILKANKKMHLSSMDDMKLFVDTYLSARKSEPLRILDLGSMEYGPTYRQFFQ